MKTSQASKEQIEKEFLNVTTSPETENNKPFWSMFPDYEEELSQIISIMPRQMFELPENDASSGACSIERTTSDHAIKIKWSVGCLFGKIIDPETPGLFYKIETLIIRPLISKNSSRLKNSLSLGTPGEIAALIGIEDKNLIQIREALLFGAMIRIHFKVEGFNKKTNRIFKNLESSFSLFDLPAAGFSAENGEEIYIFPTTSYAEILTTALNVEKGRELSQLEPFAIRLIEIFYWKALVDKEGKETYSKGDSLTQIACEELAELFPIRDATKLLGLVSEVNF